LKDTLHCATSAFSPCASNSCWQNVLAKKPRSSVCRSSSMTNAPASLVSVKIKSHQPLVIRASRIFRLQHALGFHRLPAQVRIQAPRCQQSLDMIDALVPRALEVLDAQVHFLVSLVQFACAATGIPLWLKRWKYPGNAREI